MLSPVVSKYGNSVTTMTGRRLAEEGRQHPPRLRGYWRYQRRFCLFEISEDAMSRVARAMA